jgi:hypothetical protein
LLDVTKLESGAIVPNAAPHDLSGGVLERMRRIGVQEAATVCVQHLDGDLRGDGAERDGLLGAFGRCESAARVARRRRFDVNWLKSIDDCGAAADFGL